MWITATKTRIIWCLGTESRWNPDLSGMETVTWRICRGRANIHCSGGILVVILASKSLKIYIILFCYEFGKYCKTKNTPAQGFPFWPVTSDFHCLWMAQLPASASQRIAVLNAVIGFTDMPIHLYWLQLHLRGKTLLAKNCLAVFLFTDWLKDFFLGRLKS